MAKKTESIADLNCAIGYLDMLATDPSNPTYRELAKDLVQKVRDRLAQKHKHAGRAWTETRRDKVLAASHKIEEFKALNHTEIGRLYDIVVAEHENWDGEDVSIDRILGFMADRYYDAGLTPARN